MKKQNVSHHRTVYGMYCMVKTRLFLSISLGFTNLFLLDKTTSSDRNAEKEVVTPDLRPF